MTVLSMRFCILQNIFCTLQYSFKLGVLYMVTTSVNKELIKLRNLSSVFSRNAFVDVLNYNAYSHFNWLASKYDTLKCTTYFELLKKSYSLISKYYRCEYVYKNEGYVVNNPPCLYNGARNTIVSSNDSLVWEHDENCSLFDDHYADVWRRTTTRPVCGFYYDTGHCNGRRTGNTQRSHYGGIGIVAIHVRFR